MSAVLSATALSIGYSGYQVAQNLTFTLHSGSLVCLLGPNGAGKSTLLRTLCAMQPPLSGQVLISGEDIHQVSSSRLARLLSVVLTERVNAGLLSAYEIASLGRYPHTGWDGRLREQDHRIVRECIELVGAQDLAARPFSELSDGERQKVMLARALAQQPSLMILDEITAFLDLPRRVDVMRILRRLAHARGCTILLSTHDLDLALRSADEVWLLEKGGQLHRGAPEELVLNGSFAAAFRSEGVEFDSIAGQFRLHDRHIASIACHGEGEVALWTRRALERLGFTMDSSAPLAVLAEPGRWTIKSGSGNEIHTGLQSLLSSLRSQIGAP